MIVGKTKFPSSGENFKTVVLISINGKIIMKFCHNCECFNILKGRSYYCSRNCQYRMQNVRFIIYFIIIIFISYKRQGKCLPNMERIKAKSKFIEEQQLILKRDSNLEVTLGYRDHNFSENMKLEDNGCRKMKTRGKVFFKIDLFC
jgi:hypothetical protein